MAAVLHCFIIQGKEHCLELDFLILCEWFSNTLSVFTSLSQNSYKIQINDGWKLHVGSEWSRIDLKSDKEENREREAVVFYQKYNLREMSKKEKKRKENLFLLRFSLVFRLPFFTTGEGKGFYPEECKLRQDLNDLIVMTYIFCFPNSFLLHVVFLMSSIFHHRLHHRLVLPFTSSTQTF